MSNNKQDITPYNENGQRHGYWKTYYGGGQLSYKGHYVNGQRHGFWLEYWGNGSVFYKGTYLNGNGVGYWAFDSGKKIFFLI